MPSARARPPSARSPTEHGNTSLPAGRVATTTRVEAQTALDTFQRTVETGDLQSLLDILAPDVVALSDAGGAKPAVLQPIVGADRVARLLVAALKSVGAEMSVEPVQVNGWPALLMRFNGELEGVVAVRIDDGLITELYIVRNPEKLSRVDRETTLRR